MSSSSHAAPQTIGRTVASSSPPQSVQLVEPKPGSTTALNFIAASPSLSALTVGSLKVPSNTPVEAVNFTVKPAAAFFACFVIALTFFFESYENVKS